MTKKPPVRLGDARFDRIQDSLDLLTPLNQDDQETAKIEKWRIKVPTHG